MTDYTTFSVMFFVRKHHNEPETLFIYARITVDGKRTEISLKRSIPVNHWDTSKGRAKGTIPEIRSLNQYLDQVYSKFLECHKQLSAENKVISAHTIKARFYGRDTYQKTLKDLIAYHNTTMTTVLKPGTMKNYYTTANYLNEFLESNLGVDDIRLSQLDYKFITDFEHFIRTYRAKIPRRICKNNGTMKHQERLMKMVNLAVKLEWVLKDPFKNYQLKYLKTEKQYLSERELQLLEHTTFRHKTMESVKDLFIFACYSGLSYIDLKELTHDHIVKGMDGRDWIKTHRAKTNEIVNIPLLKTARDILAKYSNYQPLISNAVFPVLSNQKMNSYLKEIIKAAGIRKHITFHSARHTFGTTVTLSNGVPLETVSKLMGHTKISTTQIYARILQNKLSSDMMRLEQTFEEKRQSEEKIEVRII